MSRPSKSVFKDLPKHIANIKNDIISLVRETFISNHYQPDKPYEKEITEGTIGQDKFKELMATDIEQIIKALEEYYCFTNLISEENTKIVEYETKGKVQYISAYGM